MLMICTCHVHVPIPCAHAHHMCACPSHVFMHVFNVFSWPGHMDCAGFTCSCHRHIFSSLPLNILLHMQCNSSVNNNRLTGNIPESIGSLTKLSQLVLSYNRFDGTIPEGIGNMKYLEVL
ncbi:unnamed protein product [Closterium sp. Yama58-4]|nr:unnamed protein product [Closterium sp. Yama58-4]